MRLPELNSKILSYLLFVFIILSTGLILIYFYTSSSLTVNTFITSQDERYILSNNFNNYSVELNHRNLVKAFKKTGFLDSQNQVGSTGFNERSGELNRYGPENIYIDVYKISEGNPQNYIHKFNGSNEEIYAAVGIIEGPPNFNIEIYLDESTYKNMSPQDFEEQLNFYLVFVLARVGTETQNNSEINFTDVRSTYTTLNQYTAEIGKIIDVKN